MAISSVGSNSRPGVCTSTSRPSAPFEGQMIYETDTDLTYIYGGSAWQQVSGGTAVGNSGLVYVTSTTATSGTIAINNCFTTTYDSYRVLITQTNVTLTGTTLFQFRSSGTPISNDYYYGGQVLFYNTTPSSWYTGPTSAFVTMIASGAVQTQSVIDLSFPRSANRKQFTAQSTSNHANYIGTTTHGIVNLTASNYDGMQITQDAGGTITATITIYGYRK